MGIEARGLLKCYGKESDLTLFGSRAKLAELSQEFKVKPGEELEILITFSKEKRIYKSRPMLGYLYGHLAPLLLQHLRSLGWQIATKERAIERIKEHLDFVEWVDNSITGERYQEKLSVATAPKERVQTFIEDLFILLHTESVNKPLTPEGYRSVKNKKI